MKASIVALCVICRTENKYIQEFVDYYLSLGFDKIFLYDNNRQGEEHLNDVLQPNSRVEIVSWEQSTGNMQLSAYQDCYDRHSTEFEWIAFFDADEYLVSPINIKIFLKQKIFDNFNSVSFPCVIYSDSGLITNPSSTRLDKYTIPFHEQYEIWFKSVIRTGLNVKFMDDENLSTWGCHLPFVDGTAYCKAGNSNGAVLTSVRIPFDADYISQQLTFIKHIPTGCIDDYINIKAKRGWPGDDNTRTFQLNEFFWTNEYSLEKEEYWNSKMNRQN